MTVAEADTVFDLVGAAAAAEAITAEDAPGVDVVPDMGAYL